MLQFETQGDDEMISPLHKKPDDFAMLINDESL
jgi:hypothetical protein